MENNSSLLSPTRLKRLETQGYFNYSDQELSGLAFGNRFAYILCTSILTIGVVTASIPILVTMMMIALGGVLLLYHPFDYIYNHLLRQRMDKPLLPPRSKQLKFACGMATVTIAATIYLFSAGFSVAGYVVGGMLVSVALLVSTTDICIPSIAYNFLFKSKV